MSFPTLIFEVGLGQPAGGPYMTFDDPVNGKFDTGQFAPDSFGWVDLSSGGRARGFSSRMGRSRALDKYQPGTGTVVFNNRDDYLDPDNLASPYVGRVVPMVPVRVRAADPTSGIIYPIGRWFADNWSHDYPGQGADATATVQCTDGFKVLAAFEPPGPGLLVGAGEDAGARITRILDNADWSPVDRDIDTGYTTLQGTPLSADALSECQGVETSELGYFYMSADGRATFRQRHSRITDTRSSVVQAAFGNHGGLLPYQDIKRADDDLLLKNSISGQILGGEAQTYLDSASVADFLTHSYNATGLWLEEDPDAAEWAAWVSAQFSQPERRIESIKLLPQRNDALWPVVLGLQIGDLVTISHITKAGQTIARELFVEGIAHSADAKTLRWETTLSFSSATVLQSGEWMIFDDPVMGLFDTGAFAG